MSLKLFCSEIPEEKCHMFLRKDTLFFDIVNAMLPYNIKQEFSVFLFLCFLSTHTTNVTHICYFKSLWTNYDSGTSSSKIVSMPVIFWFRSFVLSVSEARSKRVLSAFGRGSTRPKYQGPATVAAASMFKEVMNLVGVGSIGGGREKGNKWYKYGIHVWNFKKSF